MRAQFLLFIKGGLIVGNAVNPKLLELLVCPVTKLAVVYDASANELISKKAGLAYPIKNGVPVMLPEEARPLTLKERK